MTEILVVLGAMVAFAVVLLGGTTLYDRRVATKALPWFGTGAGLYVVLLRRSTLLGDRLANVQWRRAARRGINHGRCLLDDTALHWAPSLLTNKRVPSFDVTWPEVVDYNVKPGMHLLGRQVAEVELTLTDGSALRFASSDPDGWQRALQSFVGQ